MDLSVTNTSRTSGMFQDLISRAPFQFDFVQLIRLIYLYNVGDDLGGKLVGYENLPEQELARFYSSTRMRHSSSDIRAIELGENGQYEIEVNFIGLIGAAGVLPNHYSKMVLTRLKSNDPAMRDFFDLFHHRFVSNFFRASTKYRLPYQHELFSRFNSRRTSPGNSKTTEKDSVTRALSSLVGMFETSSHDRMLFDDRLLLYYAGNFSNRRPTAIGLRRMLAEFAETCVSIRQFQFEWFYLDPDDQTSLSAPKQLGENVVIGDRVGSFQSRFRIRLGPLKWKHFQTFLPSREKIRSIAQFVRTYVGMSLDFDFQLLLDGREIPCAQLGAKDSCNLGWNTWIKSKEIHGEIDDVVLEVKDRFNQF